MSSTVIEDVPMFDLARQLESCGLFDDEDPADNVLGLSPLTTPGSLPDTFPVELPPDDVGSNGGMGGPTARNERLKRRNKQQSKNNRKKRARLESEAWMDGPPPRAKAAEKHAAAALYERTAAEIADRPATKGAYTALNRPIGDMRVISLEELQDRQGFKLIEWDGR